MISIIVSGGQGVGKTTVIREIAKALFEQGYTVETEEGSWFGGEPGGRLVIKPTVGIIEVQEVTL